MNNFLRVDQLELRASVGRVHIESLFLAAGQLAVIAGPVGIGKSAVLQCLASGTGIVSGRVHLRTCTFEGPPHPLAWRHGVALVHQHRLIFVDMTACENIRIGWRMGPSTLPWKICLQRCCEIADTLSLLLCRRADGLSGGERRLIAVMRAHAADPSILILDEPMAGMDDVRRHWLFSMIRRWQSEGRIVLISVQDEDANTLPWADVAISLYTSTKGAVVSRSQHLLSGVCL